MTIPVVKLVGKNPKEVRSDKNVDPRRLKPFQLTGVDGEDEVVEVSGPDWSACISAFISRRAIACFEPFLIA